MAAPVTKQATIRQTGESIKITGLRELSGALSQADRDLYNALRRGHTAVAKSIVDKAKARAQSLGGVAAKAAPSIAARAQATSALIALGSERYPFALGAEFGGIVHRQFKPWRGSGEGSGYFLYPVIRSTREQTIAEYERLLRVLFDRIERG